jgi:Ca-activated chloride channel family protein
MAVGGMLAVMAKTRPYLLALLLGAALPALAGQEAPQASKPPVFGIESDIVKVTATVRDGQGRLVSDLKSADFVVLDEGRPQSIQVFSRAFDSPRYVCPKHPEVFGEEPSVCYRCGAALILDHGHLAVDLALLLDTSGSMLQELKLSQEAAVRFLDAIPRARELYTIFFADDIRVSRYDGENQQGLIERILEAKGGGNTSLYDAVAVYLSRIHGHGGRKVLVLFTDGEDTRSDLSMGDALELLRASDVTVYAIAFTGTSPRASAERMRAAAFLQQSADMTGGQVFRPQSSKDLPAIYGKILDELGAQYVLGFSPAARKDAGRFRKLRVEVRRAGVRVRHRAGYYAPAGPSEPASR